MYISMNGSPPPWTDNVYTMRCIHTRHVYVTKFVCIFRAAHIIEEIKIVFYHRVMWERNAPILQGERPMR